MTRRRTVAEKIAVQFVTTPQGRHAVGWEVLAEAMAAGLASTWERRARALEAARPRPGDFTGQKTREQLSSDWQRLTETAQACRARAEIARRYGHPDLAEDLAALTEGVAQ